MRRFITLWEGQSICKLKCNHLMCIHMVHSLAGTTPVHLPVIVGSLMLKQDVLVSAIIHYLALLVCLIQHISVHIISVFFSEEHFKLLTIDRCNFGPLDVNFKYFYVFFTYFHKKYQKNSQKNLKKLELPEYIMFTLKTYTKCIFRLNCKKTLFSVCALIECEPPS